ncbi:hypothetical protein CYMTET_34314 [Cymbomonas tetramitiformis]|uniref:Uncharacterized protein n=1 Tax=Cymbomonas tetramitiformis TaxID=36881 RepID=A0AAE0FB62_9CHLO|nr:hypothetical protein CYMTET_34314 [Cymbomonas tetramitiformis]
MSSRRKTRKNAVPIHDLIFERSLGYIRPLPAQRQSHFHEACVSRLRLCTELRGHQGCVNRISWNEEGTKLVSGSDDRSLLIWSYSDVFTEPIEIDTGHRANIFGARFIPCSGDRVLVSGAMDKQVRLHTVDPDRTVVYNVHTDRVKAVEVEHMNPHLFFSAAEDGTVQQFDLRMHGGGVNHEGLGAPTSTSVSTVLLGAGPVGNPRGPPFYVELKHLAINRMRPYELAIAAGDPFVRIYDRRYLCPGGAQPQPAMLYLTPPHLADACSNRRGTETHVTSVAFSSCGASLVANYHSDHVYTFDVRGAGHLDAPPYIDPQGPGGAWSMGAEAEVEESIDS